MPGFDFAMKVATRFPQVFEVVMIVQMFDYVVACDAFVAGRKCVRCMISEECGDA